MGEVRSAFKIVVRKCEGKDNLGDQGGGYY
jgi:hypothetical protein